MGAVLKRVASYADSCVRGLCSIWSLRPTSRDLDSSESVLTIEVNLDGTSLMQAAAFKTACRTTRRKLLETWMQRSELEADVISLAGERIYAG